jgi:muramoyltetrapeptide carboxypeptidase
MDSRTQRPVVPKALKKGDIIGIVAPAGPFDKAKLHAGTQVLESMGFKVFLPDGLFKKDDYLAGPDAHRAETLNRLFENDSIRAIMCARGGFGSLRILSLINTESVRNNPKIFIGFSDITAIHSFLYTKCDLVSFHGPMATTLADNCLKTRDALFEAITAGKKLRIKPEKGRIIQHGLAQGPVFGGNMATLCHLTGTEYEPDLKGHILFFEDTDEPLYKIDRMLTHMKLAGVLDGVAGIVLGSFKNCGKPEGVCTIFERMFRDEGIPVLAGFVIGHEKSNMTVPIGLKATLDTDNHLFLFHEPSTCGN